MSLGTSSGILGLGPGCYGLGPGCYGVAWYSRGAVLYTSSTNKNIHYHKNMKCMTHGLRAAARHAFGGGGGGAGCVYQEALPHFVLNSFNYCPYDSPGGGGGGHGPLREDLCTTH